MKTTELNKVTVNVVKDTIYVMPYGEFCKEQAEYEGMRFDVEQVDNEWKASGYHENSYIDESFKKYFNSEEEAEFYCQEIAFNYLNNNPDYISATYQTAKDAAEDVINYSDIEDLTDGELDENCSIEDLTNYIQNIINNL